MRTLYWQDRKLKIDVRDIRYNLRYNFRGGHPDYATVKCGYNIANLERDLTEKNSETSFNFIEIKHDQIDGDCNKVDDNLTIKIIK